eukprot:9474617-Pyramimonas_sp.AAC.1
MQHRPWLDGEGFVDKRGRGRGRGRGAAVYDRERRKIVHRLRNGFPHPFPHRNVAHSVQFEGLEREEGGMTHQGIVGMVEEG